MYKSEILLLLSIIVEEPIKKLLWTAFFFSKGVEWSEVLTFKSQYLLQPRFQSHTDRSTVSSWRSVIFTYRYHSLLHQVKKLDSLSWNLHLFEYEGVIADLIALIKQIKLHYNDIHVSVYLVKSILIHLQGDIKKCIFVSEVIW